MAIRTGIATDESFIEALENVGPFKVTSDTKVDDTWLEVSDENGIHYEKEITTLSNGTTPEILKQVLSSISGEATELTKLYEVDEELVESPCSPVDITNLREVKGITGFSSTNEMILSTINSDGEAVSKYKVDIIFISKGNVVELDEVPTLGDITGVLEGEDPHYEFSSIDKELKDVSLSFKYNGKDYTVTKSYSTFTDDIIVLDKLK